MDYLKNGNIVKTLTGVYWRVHEIDGKIYFTDSREWMPLYEFPYMCGEQRKEYTICEIWAPKSHNAIGAFMTEKLLTEEPYIGLYGKCIWRKEDISINGRWAIDLIRKERERQINEEGYSHDIDDGWENGQLANAASCYAETPQRKKTIYNNSVEVRIDRYHRWPFVPGMWKDSPNNRIRELVKAGALIVAEIERLKRK